MIYLLCFVLLICGEWRWVILVLRLYREVKRINKQKEIILPYPCKKCGEYPIICTDRRYKSFNIWEVKHWCPSCWNRNSSDWYKEEEWGKGAKEKAIKKWNEAGGTLDELELKMIREGIKFGG